MSSVSGISKIRLSGLASGLDTDSIVQTLMTAEKSPLNKLKQKQQLAEWMRDDYRAIIEALSNFNKAYLDVTSSLNMRSKAQYKKFTSSVTNAETGNVSTSVSAVGGVDASSGTHTIVVSRLATAATETSSSEVSKNIESGDLRGELALSGKSLKITLDGVTKAITFSSNYVIDGQASGDAFAQEFQSLIDEAFGKGIGGASKVNVLYDNSTGKITLSTAAGASKITVYSAAENDALGVLGIKTGSSNRISTSRTLADLAGSFATPLTFYTDPGDGREKLKFSINGKEFVFTSDTTLSTVFTTINNDSDANVSISYDSTTDRITIVSKQEGAGQNIKITNTWGNFFGTQSATGIDPSAANFGANGQDALVVLDGKELTRSSNTFTEAGITYTLNRAEPGVVNNVTLRVDVDAIYNNIKEFITKYNELVDTIYKKVSESYDSDYPPLTDDQREEMSEDEIKKWEEKAKTGLLSNDATLNKILSDMRLALIQPIEGIKTSLYQIGISSQSYLDRGKLSIDEDKLKAAIQSDPDGVMNLFAKQSTTLPSYTRSADASQKAARYNEEGVAQRIYDIIQNNISVLRDSNGCKGTLVEKAGLPDGTDTTSFLAKQIAEYEEKIEQMEKRLAEKEEAYYAKFTAMETALEKLNSQLASLQNYLNLGSD